MPIRKAAPEDEARMITLLDQLGYSDTSNLLKNKIINGYNNVDADLLVHEIDNEVVGIMAIDFITQLNVNRDCR